MYLTSNIVVGCKWECGAGEECKGAGAQESSSAPGWGPSGKFGLWWQTLLVVPHHPQFSGVLVFLLC